MRILVITHQLAKVGGIETYLDMLCPALAAHGHHIALASDLGIGDGRNHVRTPPDAPVWCALDLGGDEIVARARRWNPDIIFTHGLGDVRLESALCQLAPAVFFAHAYSGTCITAQKTFKFPEISPCHRVFGRECLAQYYPRRCGGISPFTMWHEYNSQSMRLGLLRRCGMILTASEYMRVEYANHGIPPDRIRCVPLPVTPYPQTPNAHRSLAADGELHLLFAGRMTLVKGGALLLDALPSVLNALRRPLRMTFAGDGPERRNWERRARSLRSTFESLRIEFPGWLTADELGRVAANTDLLVVPSLWPEPFGLIGPELGRFGVPAVAFDVGGISEWLASGVNGCLVPAVALSAEVLAGAIVECLRDPARYQRLSEGAAMIASRFTLERHLECLMPILHEVAGRRFVPHESTLQHPASLEP